MDTHLDKTNLPVRSPEQRAADELIKLIVKLRWMGLEDEADCIEKRLASYPKGEAESVLAQIHATD